jgi:predicted membrane protein
MIQNRLKVSNFIALLIGVLLLLSAQDILAWGTLSKLIIPLILLGIGLSIMFRGSISKDVQKIKELSKDGLVEFTAVFSGQEIKAPNEKFEGANIDAIFGGIDLDLREAIIEKDIIINASAIFGGIDIIVPSNVIVKTSNVPIFGGLSNKGPKNSEGAHTIYVNGFCMFGGVDIK